MLHLLQANYCTLGIVNLEENTTYVKSKLLYLKFAKREMLHRLKRLVIGVLGFIKSEMLCMLKANCSTLDFVKWEMLHMLKANQLYSKLSFGKNGNATYIGSKL